MPLNESFSLWPAHRDRNIEVVHVGKSSNHVDPIVIFWIRFDLSDVHVFVRHVANSKMHVHCTYNTFHSGFKSKDFYSVQQFTNKTVQLVPE